MPDLADIVAAPRSDILPGFQLSPFSIDMIAQAEFEFARKHLEVVAAAAEIATDRIARLMLSIANNEIANKQFVYGANGFILSAFSTSNLPFLLWLTMGEKHPTMMLPAVRPLITKANEDKVKRGVLELLGYDFSKPKDEKKKPEANPVSPQQSTGDQSLPPSEKQASADATSAK